MKLEKEFYIGRVLAGGYKIHRFVGSGAFAFVYLASDPSGQRVAVKIQYNLADDAQIRFGREIKVLKALPVNDYLIRYYDDGVTQEGFPYLVMEFVDGTTLKDSLRKKSIWPVNECCEFILKLCDAFGGLHELGLAHRDVKPENIMLTKHFQVKLMDLGLVKDAQGLLKLLEEQDVLEGRDFSDNLDKGVLAGTPEYMAPEQFSDPSLEDESQEKTDTWTDVYSLALIFYEMLTGLRLFPFVPNNNSQAEYARSLLDYLKVRTNQNDSELLPHPNIPYQLWTVLARALHSDPRLRQRNASFFADDLRRYMTTGEGVVEQESDKTSAIDLELFHLSYRGGASNVSSAVQASKTAYGSSEGGYSYSGMNPAQVPVYYGQEGNPYSNGYGQAMGNAQGYMIGNGQGYVANPPQNIQSYYYDYNPPQDNTALWIILILILIAGVGALGAIVYFYF